MKNKLVKALSALLFFVISSTVQAVIPVIDPTGHDLNATTVVLYWVQ